MKMGHQFRLGDLRGWHIITATCGKCRNRTHMRLWEITARHSQNLLLRDLDRKLRCKRCGNREGNRIIVTMMER